MTPFSPKDWRDYPDTTTPITAAALEDMEDRLSDYTDSVGGSVTYNNTYNVDLDPGAAVDVGIDVWTSEASPGSVTDWGTVINSLVAAGETHLSFSAHDFPFTTALDLHAHNSVVFSGTSGLRWADYAVPSTGDAAKLIWKGTGSGRAIDCRSSDSLLFRDLVLTYDSSSYTGDFIDLGLSSAVPSSMIVFEGCRIGPGTIKTARCLVRTDNAVMPILRNCSLTGAVSAIRGWETSGTIAGNDLVLADCVLSGCVTFLMNVGLNWRVDNCTFEFTDTSTVCGVDSDITFAGAQSSDLWLTDCTFWDPANSSQIAIRQKVGNPMYVRVLGGYVGQFTPVNFQFNGVGSVHVDGVSFSRSIGGSGATALIDVGTTAATARKNSIYIASNSFPTSDDTGLKAISNLDGGHDNIWVFGNRGAADGNMPQRELRTLFGQERLGYAGAVADFRPAIAAHSGQTHLGVTEIFGNDVAGVIYIRTDGSALSSGSVLDVTFGKSLIAGSGSGASSNTIPLIHLSPLESAGASASAANYYAAQPYAKVTHNTLTGFELGTVNAVGAGHVIAVAYRVVMI